MIWHIHGDYLITDICYDFSTFLYLFWLLTAITFPSFLIWKIGIITVVDHLVFRYCYCIAIYLCSVINTKMPIFISWVLMQEQ